MTLTAGKKRQPSIGNTLVKKVVNGSILPSGMGPIKLKSFNTSVLEMSGQKVRNKSISSNQGVTSASKGENRSSFAVAAQQMLGETGEARFRKEAFNSISAGRPDKSLLRSNHASIER